MDGNVYHCGRAQLPDSRWQAITEPTLTRAVVATQELHLYQSIDSRTADSARASADIRDSLRHGHSRLAHNHKMAGSPYIKPEPNDFGFDPNQYMQYQNQQQFNAPQGMNINPANLSQSVQGFGQNSIGSFNIPNSGIGDDELLELEFTSHNTLNNNQQNGASDWNQGMQNFFNQQQQMNQQNTGLYSHTPDGQPMQSPFTHGNFNYAGFRPVGEQQAQQQFAGSRSMPQQAAHFRPQMQHVDRKVSDSRSTGNGTPSTPYMQVQQIGDDQPGMVAIQHQRQKSSMGNSGWDSTSDHQSWNEGSPFPSPVNGHLPMHPQISEVLKTNTHHHGKVASSLPTKMEGGPAYASQEAKRRRRRESHNLVERRRRDNINELIQDLGLLVPQHRLEDEKVRKHLQTNAPLSPSITNATGMSPPAAPSLLAGQQQRRSTGAGSITQGLPIEEKDKGPNKGDILNGSVAWTRDLMWYLRLKMQQERETKVMLESLGQAWPYEQTNEERRMHSEICEILNKQASTGTIDAYTRGMGTGLRVPGFTNVAGDAVDAQGNVVNGTGTSPGLQSGGSGMSSGGQQGGGFWSQEFKEEDEYGMEMQ